MRWPGIDSDEIGRDAEQLKKLGFLNAPVVRKNSPYGAFHHRQPKKFVVVNKRARLSKEEIRERMLQEHRIQPIPDAVQIAYTVFAKQYDARAIVFDNTASLHERISAAESLGYHVTYRGSKGKPRGIKMWDSKKRTRILVIMLPKGTSTYKKVWH